MWRWLEELSWESFGSGWGRPGRQEIWELAAMSVQRNLAYSLATMVPEVTWNRGKDTDGIPCLVCEVVVVVWDG